jgi:hypothetical protein
MPSGEKKVFRSFGEMRAHFFPKQAKKERERAGVENIMDEAKFDQSGLKRQLTKDDEELMREMGL